MPQSHTSSPSRTPLPQAGSPTVMMGSLVRQRLRDKEPKPSLRSSSLHWLHMVGCSSPEMAAIMHCDWPSVQLQLAALERRAITAAAPPPPPHHPPPTPHTSPTLWPTIVMTHVENVPQLVGSCCGHTVCGAAPVLREARRLTS